MIAGAVAADILLPGAGIAVTGWIATALTSVASMGVSMEASAISQALQDQRGVGLTMRQAAGLRQIVYGMQRIGGTIIYRSSTGAGGSGGNYIVNYIIVLASHELDGIVNLYLDGRQVLWSQTNYNPGFHSNVGCGSVSNPPTTHVTISGGAITGITATGGSGFANVKPHDGYRVRINDTGGGTGARAWAYNSGTPSSPVWTVTMDHGGANYTSATVAEIQGAFTFGGVGAADQQDPSLPGYGLGYGIAPGGAHYDFQQKVYCEARFGDQLEGDVMGSLTANDSAWSSSGAPGGGINATATAVINPINDQLVAATVVVHGEGYSTAPNVYIPGATAEAFVSGGQVTGISILTAPESYDSPPPVTIAPPGATGRGTATPWVGGCAYIYLNVGYDQAQFPNEPEIKITVTGKNNIYDPRTSTTGYSTNWALQVADVITDPVFGLGDSTVNQAQLIASANVCDELIPTSQGNERNYAQHIHYDTSVSPGDALSMMLPAAAGRVSRVGGEWYIFPAYWQGASYTLDESSLLDDIQWNPYRSFRDLINRVNGTYIAPNSPYNVSGNLYDANGFWYGATANLWPLSWQPTNYPQYAADALHGYGEDVFLTADGGIQLPMELSLRGVISIVQAQRLAKIALLRNRQQGMGTFKMSLDAWQMIPTSVMQFSFPAMSWTNKYLEIDKIQLIVEPQQGENGEVGAMNMYLAVNVQESDPSVYEWSEGEELTPYDVPANSSAISTTVPPPTNLSVADNATTALLQSDGTEMPRLEITWTPPNDTYVNIGGYQQIQWQDSALSFNAGGWVDAGTVSGTANCFFIDSVSSVTGVNVQIRAVRSNGAASVWVQWVNWVLRRPLRPPLSHAYQVVGTTPNPTVAASFADLPELGTSNSAMSIPTSLGISTTVGVSLTFASISGGGVITNIGTSFSSTTGVAPPGVGITISGNGSGASASVSFTQTGSYPTFTYTPMLTLTGGSNYTTATATVTIVSNGDSGYTSGTQTHTCTVSSPTGGSDVVIAGQVLMDGAAIIGPFTCITGSDGIASYNVTQLITPTAATHSFQVQAMTSGTAVSTNRIFTLIELA